MSCVINDRIFALRNKMQENNIGIYIVPTNDYHSSEYVADYFKTREYITGFTGSAGVAVITMNEAGLWTDGRYFIQAEKELNGSEVTLYKFGLPGTPDIIEYVTSKIGENERVGFDGKCISADFASRLRKSLENKKVQAIGEFDLIGEIWDDRPQIIGNEIYELSAKYTGITRSEKIALVRAELIKNHADKLILTSLDEIAWMLNLRGSDIECNPVFFSYIILDAEKVDLFVLPDVISKELEEELNKDNVFVYNYYEFYNELDNLDGNIQLDKNVVNSYILDKFLNEKLIDRVNPTLLMKAIKTKTEVENERIAHIKDGVAVTKFIYWLKQNIGKEKITESSAANYLEKLREVNENYKGPSFEPIVAYKENGAMCHYSPDKENSAIIQQEGLLLFDTGGQYLEGTTDITRTITLGNVTKEEKLHYTLVLKGNLKLSAAKFLYGTKGQNLDYIARESLWEYGLDYNHGTGHGVGYFLNVHEGPNSIRSRIVNSKCPDNDIIREGMITSNEPGLYLEGKYGIRLENLIVCNKIEVTEFGQFMGFEVLTMVPFDIECIDVDILSERERILLNDYHKKVYNVIAPYLDDNERKWLEEVTRPI